jgi:hypothetical protein
MGTVHIWPEKLVERGEVVVTSATIEMPEGDRRVLSCEVPREYATSISPTCDPFVVGAIQILMGTGHDGHVHGQVSPSLLHNLEEYVAARPLWRPRLSRVGVRADVEREPTFGNDRSGALLAYSGGVDSGFTAFRHTQGRVHSPRKLVAGVMAVGFDIPYTEREGFARAAQRSRQMLGSLGLGLIPMSSNYRAVVGDAGYNVSWGSAVASCLMMLQGGFSVGVLSQSVAYDDLRELDWGCNPLTDRLLSCASFEIVPDGAEFSRIDKVRTLNDWPEFRSFARVCWQAPERDRNCCRCEKCIRTMLAFRVLGHGLPPCFDHDVTIDQIMALDQLTEKSMAAWYDSILQAARQSGVDEPWTRALSQRLALNRKAKTSRMRRQLGRLVGLARRVKARAADSLFSPSRASEPPAR